MKFLIWSNRIYNIFIIIDFLSIYKVMYHGVYWCTNYMVFIFKIKIIKWRYILVICLIKQGCMHRKKIVPLRVYGKIKFEYNNVEIKSSSANMTKLECTFLDMWGDLYSSRHIKNTPIVASSYGRCGNINFVWLIFTRTLITLHFILYWP